MEFQEILMNLLCVGAHASTIDARQVSKNIQIVTNARYQWWNVALHEKGNKEPMNATAV